MLLAMACAPSPPHAEEAAAGTPQSRQAAPQDRGPPDGPYLVVLGNGQDGGDPQVGDGDLSKWRGRERRLASCLGLIDPASGGRWLFEATPDLARQLVALDELAPRQDRPGLEGVFLTHAHVGHYAGLIFFGHEVMGASGLPVWAMPEMTAFLRGNGPWSQLVDYGNIALQPLRGRQPVEIGSGLVVTPIPVPHRREFAETVAFRIEGPRSTVLFLPDIDGWDDWDEAGVAVEDEIARVDVAYLDGSFWFHGEIPGRDMSGFPHPMIKESLARFASLPSPDPLDPPQPHQPRRGRRQRGAARGGGGRDADRGAGRGRAALTPERAVRRGPRAAPQLM